jgi:hypothetical protein
VDCVQLVPSDDYILAYISVWNNKSVETFRWDVLCPSSGLQNLVQAGVQSPLKCMHRVLQNVGMTLCCTVN